MSSDNDNENNSGLLNRMKEKVHDTVEMVKDSIEHTKENFKHTAENIKDTVTFHKSADHDDVETFKDSSKELAYPDDEDDENAREPVKDSSKELAYPDDDDGEGDSKDNVSILKTASPTCETCDISDRAPPSDLGQEALERYHEMDHVATDKVADLGFAAHESESYLVHGALDSETYRADEHADREGSMYEDGDKHRNHLDKDDLVDYRRERDEEDSKNILIESPTKTIKERADYLDKDEAEDISAKADAKVKDWISEVNDHWNP
jgi:hypothetical protein